MKMKKLAIIAAAAAAFAAGDLHAVTQGHQYWYGDSSGGDVSSNTTWRGTEATAASSGSASVGGQFLSRNATWFSAVIDAFCSARSGLMTIFK